MHMEQIYRQWRNEGKKPGGSGIYETSCHNDSYLLFLEKRKLESFEISSE